MSDLDFVNYEIYQKMEDKSRKLTKSGKQEDESTIVGDWERAEQKHKGRIRSDSSEFSSMRKPEARIQKQRKPKL